MDLVEFLLARIAEDEAAARRVIAPLGWGGVLTDSEALDPEEAHIARWDPARVLAECDAKRALVAYAAPADDAVEVAKGYGTADRPLADALAATVDQIANDALAPVLQYLALPYADHPDYRPEWRP